MINAKSLRFWGTVVVCGAVCFTSGRLQGAEPAKLPTGAPDAAAHIELSVRTSSHWLGLLATPLDEALKSQLNLEDRLIVQQVVPGSPAAKAGLKNHDILLKLGDAEIHRLEDLIKAIEKSQNKEATLTFLRGGKEQSVTVKPEARPAENVPPGVGAETKPWEDIVGQWLQEKGGIWRPDGSMRLRFLGPGFSVPETKFPADLSVNITKEGEKPAKIVVQRKEEKWEVTEDSLDKLPPDVRPHVERLLGRGNVLGLSSGPEGKELGVRRFGPEAIRRGVEELRADRAVKETLEEVRKQIDELRKEVEKLRQPAKPKEGGEKI